MTIFKCKMCGGSLDVQEGMTVCECEYCGSMQTIPNLDDEKKVNLFSRANRLRTACEFDKAAGVFESIVSDFPEEAEAYWGLILCKYGIEYVDDPATGKKIPTCHRSSFDSVMDDPNFELVMEYSDPTSRAVYRKEAKEIERLRTGIIEVSSKEEPYDIFICYKETDAMGDRTIDSVIAQDVYNVLTEKGYRVFFSRISLEDKLGQEYEPYIFAALNSAKVMLAFGTDYEYYNAVWVKNEWSRFLSLIAKGEKKTLIPCYKGIDAYDMPKEFARLQAQDMGKVGAIQDLVRGIEKIIPRKNTNRNDHLTSTPIAAGVVTVQSLLKRAFMFLEEGNWKSAEEYAERVLDIDPECGEAYLAKGMADLRIGKRSKLIEIPKFVSNINMQKANRFGDSVLRSELDSYVAEINRREKERLKKVEERRKKEAELRRKEEEKQRIEEEKINEIKRQKEAEKRRAEEDFVKACVKCCDEITNQKLQEKDVESKNLDSICNDIKNDLAIFEDVGEKYREIWKNLEDTKYQISTLEKKKASLGLFSKKEKKQITSEIETLSSLIPEISANYEKCGQELEKKKEIESRLSKLQKEKDKIEEERKQLKDRLGRSLTYEEAVDLFLNDDDINKTMTSSSLRVVFNMALSDKRIDLCFGKYKQDNDKILSIRWVILNKKNNRVLLISKEGIDCLQYNNELEEVTWENCSLRKWLNDSFYYESFSVEEREAIEEITVKPDINSEYDTKPGNATQDKVFLLSTKEVEEYCTNDEGMCKATVYAKEKGALTSVKGLCHWWLRTPGIKSSCAAKVYYDGKVRNRGDDVNVKINCVRPALWIDSSKLNL